MEVGSSLSAPVVLRPPSACSRISVASSTRSFRSDMSFEVEISAQVGPSELEPDRRSESADALTSAPALAHAPSGRPFTISSMAEGVGPGPSVHSPEDLDEGDNEENVPLTNVPPNASSDPSWVFGTLCDSTHVQADLSHTRDDGPPLSPSAVAVLESAPENPTHLWMQVTRSSLIDIETSPRRAWSPRPLSLSLHVDPQASSSATLTGLELSLGANTVLSPRHLPLPQTPVVPTTPSSPICHRTRNGTSISPPRSPEDHPPYPGNATASRNQVHSPLSCPSPSTRDHTQGVVGVQLSEGAAPSPRNVPLPASPASSAISSSPSARLQVQPSHRHRPDMPLYPSLEDGGSSPPPLNPDGLGQILPLGYRTRRYYPLSKYRQRQ
ncbi:hypothetical protein BGW80DRAFT_690679 [Lactifluus volemus]|nr:hypothetical protein BGW80DRAFT_690679 [Lactifluus volemus]